MNALTTVDDRAGLIQAVLDGMTSEHSKRAYGRALAGFLAWHDGAGRPALTKATVSSYRQQLQAEGKTPAVINQTLCAIRKLIREAADNGAIDPALAQGIANVKGIKSETLPAGRAIGQGEINALALACAADQSPGGVRDGAIIATLYGCGLRRAELAGLDVADLDTEAGTLVIRRGKGRKERLVHLPEGTRAALADWLALRGQGAGPLFRPIRKGGRIAAGRLTTQAVYHVLQARAKQAGVSDISPHDFRRTFISDLLDAGADIVTVQKMAGHADVSTTARYDRRGEAAKARAAGLLHVPYVRRAMIR